MNTNGKIESIGLGMDAGRAEEVLQDISKVINSLRPKDPKCNSEKEFAQKIANELFEVSKVLPPQIELNMKNPQLNFKLLNFEGVKGNKKRLSRGGFKRLKKLHETTNQPPMIVFDESYKKIDFYFQAVVYLLQRKIIKKEKWVYDVFKKYVLIKLANYKFPEKKWSVIEAIGEERRRGVPFPFFEDDSFFSDGEPRKASFSRGLLTIKEESINSKILNTCLDYITNGFFYPHNANSFGFYVRSSLYWTIKSQELKDKQRDRKRYYKPKINPNKIMRTEIIEAYSKKKRISKAGARKWLYRRLQERGLDEIFCDVFG